MRVECGDDKLLMRVAQAPRNRNVIFSLAESLSAAQTIPHIATHFSVAWSLCHPSSLVCRTRLSCLN